jgi:ATP-dependent helicase/nuclease subunit B
MILTKSNITEINFESFVESKILSNQISSVLIIVPTNRKLRELKKKIINSFTEKPVAQINIETITTFTSKLLKEHTTFIPLSEAAATVLIKEAAEELDLSYFAAYSKGIPFGTLDKIKNVISDYKKHGILPSVLEREAEKLSGGEKKKAVDIASIYQLYLKKCKHLSAFEIGDIYSAILELSNKQFDSCFESHFNSVTNIILDGFDEFTNLEIKILNLLSDNVKSNLIINFDYYSKNENLFSHLNDTYTDLIKNGFKKILDKTPLESSEFRNIVRSELFQDNMENVNVSFSDFLFKAEPNNRTEEVELIAKTIKLQLLNENVRPEDICVTFNIIGNYSSLVRDIFSKYGIPINLTDRIPIKTSPPVIAAISLLELVENDFYFHDLVRVLSSGFLEFKDIDLNNLIAVANDLKIIGGLQNWQGSIDDALSLLNYGDDYFDSEKRKSIFQYRKAKKDISSISNMLLQFRKKNNRQEFVSSYKKLLLNLKLPFKVLEESSGKEEEFIKAFTVLLQTLNEVLILIDQDVPDKKYSTQFYLEQLRTISNWARFNIKEKSDYGVLVTSINEIRGLNYDYLFLGGMCDGDFPTKYSPEIFFSGSFQKKEQIHQTEERYHFYQTLSAWNKKLILTIPQNDSDSELVESTFIKDIQKLFQFSEMETNTESEILSKEQLLIAFTRNKNNEKFVNTINKIGINAKSIKEKIEIKEKRKEDPFKEYDYSGFIGTSDEKVQNYLENFSDREFSISQFETFAKCPFKYFTERILKLEPIEEPTEEAEPIELGNVLHTILYEFYSKIVAEKIPIGAIGSKEFTNLKNVLFEIAEEKINKLNLNSPLAFFEKEKILGIDGQKENSILFKFLKTEVSSETDFMPSLFEFNFGHFFNDEQKHEIPPVTIGELKLRGKIDRIDVDENEKLFNIIDYKLKGKKPTTADLVDGLSLQLPVYLMAGQHIVDSITDDNFNGHKMMIYSLDYKEGNFGPSQINLSRKRSLDNDQIQVLNEDLISSTKEKLIEYHQRIRKGKFNLSELDEREEKVCRYCDFKSFCRVKEVFES